MRFVLTMNPQPLGAFADDNDISSTYFADELCRLNDQFESRRADLVAQLDRIMSEARADIAA